MPETAIFLCAVPQTVFAFSRLLLCACGRTWLFFLLALVPLLLTCPEASATDGGLQVSSAVTGNSSPYVSQSQGKALLLAAAQLPALRTETAPVAAELPVDKKQWVERYLKGSFLGSFFFGYPYTGVGIPDVIVMVLAGLLACRLLLGKLLTRRSGYALPREPRGGNGSQFWNRHAGTGQGEESGAIAAQRSESFGEARPVARPVRARESFEAGHADADSQALSPADAEKFGGAKKTSADGYYESREDARADSQDTVLGQWASVAPGIVLPQGFDAVYFLDWSRSLYITLQYSWAGRKIDALEEYVSREMFAILKAQAARDPLPVSVDIRFVRCRLVGIRHNDYWARVSIQFLVSMSAGSGGKVVETTETWTFVCEGDDGVWRVEAIEQA